jgi:hypothetical protein
MAIRQKRLLLVLILSVFTAVVLSCGSDDVVSPEPTIYGSWVRLITDSQGSQFNAELKIKNDNSFDFILLDNVPGHTNSSAEFTLNGDVFTIINDKDCSSDGVYKYVVSDKELALVVVTDECAPRALALRGVWSKETE